MKTRTRFVVVPSCALAVVLALASVATAIEFDSRYLSPSGPVHCIVSVNGDCGSYTLDDGSVGNLSAVRYSTVGGTQFIRGRWSLNGYSGTFEWRIPPSGGQFLGSWRGDFGGTGYWNGAEISGGGSPIPQRRPIPRRP
jgi:hypothetical protein